MGDMATAEIDGPNENPMRRSVVGSISSGFMLCAQIGRF